MQTYSGVGLEGSGKASLLVRTAGVARRSSIRWRERRPEMQTHPDSRVAASSWTAGQGRRKQQ